MNEKNKAVLPLIIVSGTLFVLLVATLTANIVFSKKQVSAPIDGKAQISGVSCPDVGFESVGEAFKSYDRAEAERLAIESAEKACLEDNNNARCSRASKVSGCVADETKRAEGPVNLICTEGPALARTPNGDEVEIVVWSCTASVPCLQVCRFWLDPPGSGLDGNPNR